jgi:hypothetical protein
MKYARSGVTWNSLLQYNTQVMHVCDSNFPLSVIILSLLRRFLRKPLVVAFLWSVWLRVLFMIIFHCITLYYTV